MKFKKIEIDAFRAFKNKEDATFDFTWRKDPSKVANLVAIYAPNGFGKTSFYDAVEWCMTNRIARLDRSDELARAERELGSDKAGESIRQYILKNRDVDKEQGEVKITFEKRKPEKRKTRLLRQRGWSDYYYKAPPNYKFPPKVEKPYFKDVILSQEGIDAFLRMDDPKERYKKFVEFFYDVKYADQLFKNITELIRENELKLKQNADELKKLKDEIGDMKVPGDAIEKTNNFIVDLKKEDLIDLSSLKPLNKDFSESDFNILNLLINTFRKKISTPGSGRISKAQDEENEINKLIAQLPGYSRAKEEKQKLLSAQKEFQKILVSFGGLKSLENVKRAKEKEISALEDERKALEKFKELRPKYIEIQKNIDCKTQEIFGLDKKIHKKKIKLTNLNSEIKKLEEELKPEKNELEELKTYRGAIDEMYKAYTLNLDKRKDLYANIEKNNKTLDDHEDKQSRLKQALSILNKLQNEINSGTVSESKERPEQYAKFYRELERLQQILKEVRESLDNLRGKAESINSLKETHDKIISFGRQYILTTKTTKCPLCREKDYDDF
jgi:exonuclease SbcC